MKQYNQTQHDTDEGDLLASTLSTSASQAHASDGFQRVNVLLPSAELAALDDKLHKLKTNGMRWANRSLLIRCALASIKDVPAEELAQNNALLRLKK
ncbi:MAG: hypothetical protein V2A73_00790 [Pseudomonadota bacterium]